MTKKERIERLEGSVTQLNREVTDLRGQMQCVIAGGHKTNFVRMEDYDRWYVFQCVRCSYSIRKKENSLTEADKIILRAVGVLSDKTQKGPNG